MTALLLELSPEVDAALKAGTAIVALESTIITHGMPYPANLETAKAVEGEIRAKGATPATIAVIEGRIKVGLTGEELDILAQAKDVVKASSRDLAVAMVKKQWAGTTVSCTMRIAELAGIRVFATGGVGGVHRGAEETFDISADLTELGRTEVAVVCAGVKSLLDIPKTLEVLETQRVPVVAYGTDHFPAFFARESGMMADHRLDAAADIAAMIKAHAEIKAGTGILVANPVPEADALSPTEIDGIIDAAVAEAAEKGIGRKALTPFLLSAINQASEGRSLKANIALVLNNARLAADIAVALAA
ncbi:pseudouridine-5'-phosphate glycosidase [Pseudooceanicola sp. CBS1P-1]|uniref:Pseudouridine-5'-phosphate glycosidase n=1 Tax=Pseudooceanicola albus TaxID=2692189 RepID=A0A6L7FXY7_9RHOB|nr:MULTISPECIES: pseudouridine-5'-phosphate glycosidase [Pseudooceanicola]MBT9383963.1 pseudouridine-5'-phosphate glycosidase [Pseudooceanicola endophyticus]MXN16625.1 pseudouridine-5-phosphate glycosidase [Pseudooceanicola albus]